MTLLRGTDDEHTLQASLKCAIIDITCAMGASLFISLSKGCKFHDVLGRGKCEIEMRCLSAVLNVQ